MRDVTHEDAMNWLESMERIFDLDDEIQSTIKYIREVLWRDNDMRNS
jgi:hypothetical protein